MAVSLNHPEIYLADVPDTVKAVVKAVGELTQWNGEHNGVGGKDVAGKIGLEKCTASRHIKKALEVGLVVNKETRKGAPQKLALGAALQPSATLQPLPATPRLRDERNPNATVQPPVFAGSYRLQPEFNPEPATGEPLLEVVKGHRSVVMAHVSNPAMSEHILTCADCSFHEYQGPNPAHGWGHCTFKEKGCYGLRTACGDFKQR